MELTREQRSQIMKGEIPCPLCNGLGRTVAYPPADDPDYSMYGQYAPLVSYTCICSLWQDYYRHVMKLPEKFRHVGLADLQPSPASFMPIEVQAALYDELRAAPLKGYAFFSPAGWSKTTVCTALYKAALWERCVVHPNNDPLLWRAGIGIWRISAPLLIAQHQNYYDTHKMPDVTAQTITRLNERHVRPRLFLEEIDKFKLTEFAQNQIFNIVNTLYEANGQLVLNANVTFPQFEELFGPPVARRVSEMCVVKNYF